VPSSPTSPRPLDTPVKKHRAERWWSSRAVGIAVQPHAKAPRNAERPRDLRPAIWQQPTRSAFRRGNACRAREYQRKRRS